MCYFLSQQIPDALHCHILQIPKSQLCKHIALVGIGTGLWSKVQDKVQAQFKMIYNVLEAKRGQC